jgi:hypothetical protein
VLWRCSRPPARMVHLSKFGSWALLVSVSVVLVASLKRLNNHRCGDTGSDFGQLYADTERPPG